MTEKPITALSNPISHIKPTLYVYVLLGLAGMYVQFNFSQPEISYLINGLHTPALDFICKYGTYLGDGWTFTAVILIVLFFNRKTALSFILTFALSALFAQLLKRLVFSDSLRPIKVLDASQIHLVSGVEMQQYLSFPSGHTTSAFALFALISFFVKNPAIKIACLLLALFAAFTRIYLLQHFFEDTLLGSVLGVFSAMIVYYAMNIIKSENGE